MPGPLLRYRAVDTRTQPVKQNDKQRPPDGLHATGRRTVISARGAQPPASRNHDTLAQGLTGIVTQLQAAEHACDDPAGWRRHFAAATGLARESLSETRRSVHELRPEPLETARLSEALADVAGRWSALHGISVQVTTTGTPRPIRPEAEFALLRTAQEALANVVRHAQATRAGVTLSYPEHQVALDVRDDGKGFQAAQLGSGTAGSRLTANGDGGPPRSSAGGSDAGGGFGLVAMRQRIESLSGTLQVEWLRVEHRAAAERVAGRSPEMSSGSVRSACGRRPYPDIPGCSGLRAVAGCGVRAG
jgi:signal transduction histidine kinase